MLIDIEKTQGVALDYLIAKAIWPHAELPVDWFLHRREPHCLPALNGLPELITTHFNPQSDWGFAGPYLAKNNIFPCVWLDGAQAYSAELPDCVYRDGQLIKIKTLGPEPLVAAWRCFVAWRMGVFFEYPRIHVELPDIFMMSPEHGK